MLTQLMVMTLANIGLGQIAYIPGMSAYLPTAATATAAAGSLLFVGILLMLHFINISISRHFATIISSRNVATFCEAEYIISNM